MSQPNLSSVANADHDPLLNEQPGLLQRAARNFSQSGISPSGFWRSLSWRRNRAERPAPSGDVGAEDVETGHTQSDSYAPAPTQEGDGACNDSSTERDEHHIRSSDDDVEQGSAESGLVRPAGNSPDTRSATAHLLSLFGRRSSGSLGRSDSATIKRSASGTQPMCLICLENLTAEDFQSGEAMSLECQCRGELALRHRSCAEKWSRVKGDRICDVCKAPIGNLPDVPPAPATDAGSDAGGSMFEDGDERHNAHPLHGPFAVDQMPGSADIVFDCIRVTWVAMIICILFFEMNLATALWTGLIVGIAYTMFARAMYRQQLAVLQREMAREHQQHLHPRSAAGGSPRAEEHAIDIEEHQESDAESGSEAGEGPEQRMEEVGLQAGEAHESHTEQVSGAAEPAALPPPSVQHTPTGSQGRREEHFSSSHLQRS